MVKVACVVDEFPQLSVAVNVTVSEPVAPHGLLNPAELWVHVTLLHISEAAAPPWLSNQDWKAAVFPAPSHSTVALEAGVSIDGAVVSSMVKVADVELVLPSSSVAVKMT